MRKIFMMIALIGSAGFCFAQKLPANKKVKTTMELANAYFMNKWPDAGKEIVVPSRNKTWPSHIWTRAVYYEGLMALYNVDPKKHIMIMPCNGVKNTTGV